MKYKILIQLIESLSNKELTAFRDIYRHESKKPIYLSLLDLILKNNNKDWEEIRELFHKKFSQASLENATSYLYKTILDLLVQNKLKQDLQYETVYALSRIKVLRERNLVPVALAASETLYKKQAKTDDLVIQYLIARNHLIFLTSNNFPDVQEKEVVAIQEKGKEILKELKNNHEHYTLYELLKYRILNQPVESANSPKKLNDLILNELAIISQSPARSMEARKIHYLFQSFYFTAINDFNAAIKTFILLNELFENKTTLNSQNIFDYFSMLDGTLNSLGMIRKCAEMPYFIKKLEIIVEFPTPEYFKYLVKKTIAVHWLSYYYLSGNATKGLDYAMQMEKDTINKYMLLDPLKQTELIFYISVTFYTNKEIKKAVKILAKIDTERYRTVPKDIYKTVKLFSLLLNYEAKDFTFLDYETRSYVRNEKGYDNLSSLEKLLFKVFRTKPFANAKKNEPEILYLMKGLKDKNATARKDVNLNKYFDFLQWCENRLKIIV